MIKRVFVYSIFLAIIIVPVLLYLNAQRVRERQYDARVESDLNAIGAAYNDYLKERKQTPQQLADLEPYLGKASPRAIEWAKQGILVIRYNAKVSPELIVAYEQSVPTKGGWVYRGSAAHRVTATEFQTAMKGQ